MDGPTATADRVALVGTAADAADELRPAIEDRLGDAVRVVVPTSAAFAADVVLAYDLSGQQVGRVDGLRWVQALTAGTDHFPTDELAERGVALTDAAGIHAEQVGEQVLGYLLTFERRIHEGIRQGRAGEWDRFQAGELKDDTLAVVGVGAIGTRVAELGDTFGMTVLGVRRDPSVVPDAVDEMHPPDHLDRVLGRADYVVLACPLTPATRGLIGAEQFRAMPESAVLVNVARGAVVDESALVDAVEGAAIRGAALDVFETEPLPAESPLRSLPNVVTTPHTAGTSPFYEERAAERFAEQYRAFADGGVERLDRVV